jgi:hypothetical protein
MARYGFVDEAAFVFWQDNRAIAFLNVLKDRSDNSINDDSTLHEIHSYVQHNLLGLPSIKEHRLNIRFTENYRLTSRELEVAKLISIGLSN